MIYSNDDADKALRKRNYLLTVIALPATVIIVVILITYFLYNNRYINITDRNYCYFLSASAATFLFAFNKRKWLKMPDGSYYRVQNEDTRQVNSLDEPAEFERAYYNSKSRKGTGIFAGVVLIVFGVFMFHSLKSYVLSVVTIIAGLFAIIDGIRGILDKSPKLQLSPRGLWTKKLGFVQWKDINKAQVITESDSEHSRMTLEIYLKNTVFSEADAPDERLLLTDIDDNRFIETDIDRFCSNATDRESENA